MARSTTSQVARWRSAAQTAAAAFPSIYRQTRRSEKKRALFAFTRFVAWIYVFGTGLYTAGTVVMDFTARTVLMELPVQQFWPALPKGAHITSGPTAHVVGGGFSAASVDVSGLDVAARVWLAASTLLQGGTIVVIAVVVATLCTTVLRGDPFNRAVYRGVRVMGITVIAGGLGWQICSSVAGSLASRQVLQLGSAQFQNRIAFTDLSKIIGFPLPGMAAQVDFWPIWVGLALLALSAVFRHGAQLKQDAEGLV